MKYIIKTDLRIKEAQKNKNIPEKIKYVVQYSKEQENLTASQILLLN
jgi:hypothetical protein